MKGFELVFVVVPSLALFLGLGIVVAAALGSADAMFVLNSFIYAMQEPNLLKAAGMILQAIDKLAVTFFNFFK